MENTSRDNAACGGLTTSAVCDVVISPQEGEPETVQLNAAVTLDGETRSRIGKAMAALQSDREVAMHGIEVRYDCNSVVAFDSLDTSVQLAVSRLRVERTYYNGKPELSVLFDAEHSVRTGIPSLADRIKASSCPEMFTYLVKYVC